MNRISRFHLSSQYCGKIALGFSVRGLSNSRLRPGPDVLSLVCTSLAKVGWEVDPEDLNALPRDPEDDAR